MTGKCGASLFLQGRIVWLAPTFQRKVASSLKIVVEALAEMIAHAKVRQGLCLNAFESSCIAFGVGIKCVGFLHPFLFGHFGHWDKDYHTQQRYFSP